MKEKKKINCNTSFRLSAGVLLALLIGAGCSQKTENRVENLVQGSPVTREIASSEVHSYQVTLEKDRYLALAVEQHDVDTIARVFTPDGGVLGEFDTPTSARGTEIVRLGAETAGDYRIDVFTLSERAEPGRYTIRMVEYRPLTDRDRMVLSAVKFHREADALRAKPETRTSSVPVYEKALAIWRELGERAEEGNTLRAMAFAYQRENDLEKAREHFGRALEIWEEIGDLRSAAFTHVIFGVMSKKQNDFEAGLRHDLSAQPLWEKAGDMPESAQNLARIGSDYVRLQNRERALAYFERALQASRDIGSRSLQAYVLSGYGDAHAAFGSPDQALGSYRESLGLWRSLGQDKAAAGVEEKMAKLQAN